MTSRVANSIAALGLTLAGLAVLGGTSGAASPRVVAPPCTAAHLSVKTGPANGTAGTTYYSLRFFNQGANACTLRGIPSAQPVVTAAHTPVGGASVKQTQGARGKIVTLAAHHGVANAQLGVVDSGNFGQTQCGPKNVNGVVVTIGAMKFYFKLPVQPVCKKLSSTRILGFALGL
jgi:hypothetical protein